MPAPAEHEVPEVLAAPVETRRMAVIFNPVKVQSRAIKAAVRSAEAQAGWGKSMWFETSVIDPGAGLAAKAVEEGADVVIAAGGDGTVRSVAEGLRGTGVPLAVVPSGTGNLLARNLSIALDNMRTAIFVAFEGDGKAIDLGIVEAERADGSR